MRDAAAVEQGMKPRLDADKAIVRLFP